MATDTLAETRQPTAMRAVLLLGVVLAASALALLFVDARAALGGWLAAFAFWGGVPIGALGLLLMIRIIPGPWEDELALPAETALLLLPLAALAILPVLAGMNVLYPWTAGVADQGIRQFYLSSWFFVLRTVLFFAVTFILAGLLLVLPNHSRLIGVVGSLVFPLLFTFVAVDWLMSLEPDFHSSVWGLYILNYQMTVALGFLILVRMLAGPASARTGILGGLLLVACLFWAYFIYIQYLIDWSGNLPAKTAWFLKRSEGGWAVTVQAMAAATLIPALFLLFAPVRSSRTGLLVLAVLVLFAKALEAIWLVVPATSTTWVGAVAAVLALVGLGLLFVGCFVLARPIASRLRPRSPLSKRAAA